MKKKAIFVTAGRNSYVCPWELLYIATESEIADMQAQKQEAEVESCADPV